MFNSNKELNRQITSTFKAKYFNYVEIKIDSHTTILVDRTTNVMYLQREAYGNNIAITPLLNADGTPKLYEDDEF